MSGTLRFRFIVIVLVVSFFALMAYQGVADQRLELGIDLKGGSELIFKFNFEDREATTRKELLKQAIGVIQERIDHYGLKDIALQPIGDNRFSVQVSAKDKAKVDAIKGLITDLGRLEFRITVEPGASQNYEAYWKRFQDALKKGVDRATAREIRPEDLKKGDRNRFPLGLRWYPLSEKAKARFSSSRTPTSEEGKSAPWVLCQIDNYDITGEALYNVNHAPKQSGVGGGWVVFFRVKKLFQGAFAKLTAFEEDKFMAIILNDHVDSAPVLRSTLSDSGEISGSFTEKESRSLAAILQAGALQTKPEMISERTIAPDLAGSARNRGVLSTLLGFALVLLIMLWLYLGPGLLANLALLLNLVLLLGVLTWFGASLTLPGIAGVVLTIGMAVDANILVFERIKEEKAKGRTLSQAISTGYDRALVTIVDSNLTTLITAYFLFQIGSGPVRGFGITLAIGIIASMFTALYVTRTFFVYFLRKGMITEARMRGAFKPPTVSWMHFTRKAVTISSLAMIAGAIFWDLAPEKKKYDLDFTKGSKLIMRFNHDVRADAVRDKITALARKDPLYREVAIRISAEGIGTSMASDRGRGFELRSQNIGTEAEIESFKQALREAFKGELLPGPFQATIHGEPGGRETGTIYFVNPKIDTVLLEQAFAQFRKTRRVLTDARVRKEKPVAGAGSVFELSFADPGATPGQIALNVRSALAEFKLADAREKLDEIANSDESTASQQEQARKAAEALQAYDPKDLTPFYFEEYDPFPLADRIDPSTAQEHRDAAVQAIALSILGIIAYVAFRFRSWSFGFAAVIALIHDVLIVLGVVALADWAGMVDARLNLVTVAAFLTLIGYSINDTIVVFDRIRENRGNRRTGLRELIDRSINQTFTRTIRTSVTTWVVVVVLFVMNIGANSSLEGFAFVLTLGVIIGTYSSIFIASPTLLYLPWLWERCGGTVRSFAKKVLPYTIASAILLIAVDWAEGRFVLTGDFSVPLFNNIFLAIPVSMLLHFLVNFVRFVNTDPDMRPAVIES